MKRSQPTSWQLIGASAPFLQPELNQPLLPRGITRMTVITTVTEAAPPNSTQAMDLQDLPISEHFLCRTAL